MPPQRPLSDEISTCMYMPTRYVNYPLKRPTNSSVVPAVDPLCTKHNVECESPPATPAHEGKENLIRPQLTLARVYLQRYGTPLPLPSPQHAKLLFIQRMEIYQDPYSPIQIPLNILQGLSQCDPQLPIPTNATVNPHASPHSWNAH